MSNRVPCHDELGARLCAKHQPQRVRKVTQHQWIVQLAASADVLRLVLSDTVALRIGRLVGSSDVLRLVLSDTVALRIGRLAASADVLRLVLSDTVALRIVRIPADRLSSWPQEAFCAWSRPFFECRHLATLL